jgi:hypothetical protein
VGISSEAGRSRKQREPKGVMHLRQGMEPPSRMIWLLAEAFSSVSDLKIGA